MTWCYILLQMFTSCFVCSSVLFCFICNICPFISMTTTAVYIIERAPLQIDVKIIMSDLTFIMLGKFLIWVFERGSLPEHP